MARIRYIKPEFFDHPELARTSPHARLLFAGLWTRADRDGRLKDEPERLRAQLFPYEPHVDAEALLEELRPIGCVTRYETNGVRYLAMLGWKDHQHPHQKEKPSEIPGPTPEQAQESTCRTGASLMLAPVLPDTAPQSAEMGAICESRDKPDASTVLALHKPGRIGIGIGIGMENSARAARPSSLVQKRDLNAVFEGVLFKVPLPWCQPLIDASRGSLTVDDFARFGAETHRAMEAAKEPRDTSIHLFAWLDAKWRDYLKAREIAAWIVLNDRELQETADRHAREDAEPKSTKPFVWHRKAASGEPA